VTPEALCSLIAGAETLDVEFKDEEARALPDGDLVEAVVCLANRSGNAPGWLLVGVEDDRRVTGARPRHADRTDPLRLQALIAHRTRPSLSARVEIVRLGGQDVIAVEVPAACAPFRGERRQVPQACPRRRRQARLSAAVLPEMRGQLRGTV
jgi:ATP-dependent DNA helicase RecG